MVGLILSILLLVQPIDKVTATTYKLIPKDQGKWGTRMASGFRVNVKHPERSRVIAVSRDLKEKYPFGTKVQIKGTGRFDGIWTVQDVMSPRFKNRIDLLIGYKTKQNRFNNVTLKKYELKSKSSVKLLNHNRSRLYRLRAV